MMRIVRTLCLMLMIAALAVGCSNTPGGDSGNSGDGGSGGGGTDMGKMMLDSMKSQPTMYAIALPPGAAVGNTWEMTMSAGGTEMKMNYAVVSESNGHLIVEKAQDYSGATLIEAWEIDPAVDLTAMPAEGESMPANVVKAWIGLPGEMGEERPVMEAPKMQGGGESSGTTDVEQGEETVELGGKSWETAWTKVGETQTWMAKGSTFILKTTNMELTAWSDEGAEAQLKSGE